MARVAKAPRRVQRPISTEEHKVGQDHAREMPNTGPAEMSDPLIEVVDGPDFKRKVDVEAFMSELVEVELMPSTERNASPFVPVWVNGRSQYFQRGKRQVVKRMFVEGLARAKKTTYEQEEYTNHLGERAIRYIPSTALENNFQVVRDLNPNGSAWLSKVLAEA